MTPPLAAAPMTGENHPSTVITWAQRRALVDLLETEARRRHEEAARLDAAFDAEMAGVEITTHPTYDEKARALDHAYDAAYLLDDLRQVLEEAKVITTQPPADLDPSSAIARALVSSWAQGFDVGAVLVDAVAQAQRIVFASCEERLTVHRPGSWEAALLDELVDSSGWDQGAGGGVDVGVVIGRG